MTKLQKNIREFMLNVPGQIVREKPTLLTREEAILRVQLILEEAFELAESLGVSVLDKDYLDPVTLKTILLECDGSIQPNLTLAADAIADLNYVVNGTACAMGIDMEPIDEEVHRSNMSKFIDGHKQADGKWMKGPSYSPANIQPLIEKQQK